MIETQLWKKISRIGWFTVVTYAAVMYVIVFGMIFSEGPFQDGNQKEVASSELIATGAVQATVRNVFGDRVPGASVQLGDVLTHADEAGDFLIEGVPIGAYDLKISASSYDLLVLSVRVEPGVNRPRIKHDTGLWPSSFAADFHVFMNKGKNGLSSLYGLVGLANGGAEDFYVRSILIVDPLGEVLQDFLIEPEDYQRIVQSWENIQTVLEPQPALVLPPRSLLELELQPLSSPLDGVYELRVLAGNKIKHESGTYDLIVMRDRAEEDEDWNPHIP